MCSVYAHLISLSAPNIIKMTNQLLPSYLTSLKINLPVLA